MPVGSNRQASATGVALQSDGKIVVAGSARDQDRDNMVALRLNADGTPDTSFAGGGPLLLPLAEGANANALKLQSDGKIILAGWARSGQYANFAVVRLNPDGTFDTTFTRDGQLIIPLGVAASLVNAVALQSNGYIVLAGSATEATGTSGTGTRSTFAVVRLKPNGGFDTTFDGDGKLLLPMTNTPLSTYPTATGVAIGPDNKIVLGGNTSINFKTVMTAVRLNADGSLDNGFDGDGKLFLDIFSNSVNANALAVRSDGTIILAGTAFVTVGLNPDGSLRDGFPNGPIPWIRVGQTIDYAQDMALQGDGKIVVVGQTFDKYGDYFSIARLNPDGSPDNTFVGDGTRTVKVTAPRPDGRYDSSAYAVAVQSDGKIVLAGTAFKDRKTFAVARLNADGSLDGSFDGDGKLLLNFGDTATCLTLQSDGKIVVGGYGRSTPDATIQFAVARLNADGSFDTTFNGNGTLILPISNATNSGKAHGITVQSDGKIVLVGQTADANGFNPRFTVARLNANGTLDNSFNGTGTLILSISGGNEDALDVRRQNDGKLVVAGYTTGGRIASCVVRLNEDGTLDDSFDGDGKLLLPDDTPEPLSTSLALQENGKIILANTLRQNDTNHFAVTRLNLDGSVDNTFAPNGLFILPADENTELLQDVDVQGDGKIILAGTAIDPANANLADFEVARIIGGSPTIAINNPRAFEEGSAANPGSVTFKVTLSSAISQPITVNYQTTDGTAKAGSDYLAKSGTLTFAPGETTKYVRIDFIGDDIAEASETFFLDLKSPTGATLADSRGTTYIRDDDGPTISIANAEPVTEGNSGTKPQKFVVTLSAPSTRQVTVDWTTANNTAGPADYVTASGTLHFNPGQTSQTITVYVKGDTVVEPNETYKVNLSNPQYAVIADSQGIAYILNDDSAAGAAGLAGPSQ